MSTWRQTIHISFSQTPVRLICHMYMTREKMSRSALTSRCSVTPVARTTFSNVCTRNLEKLPDSRDSRITSRISRESRDARASGDSHDSPAISSTIGSSRRSTDWSSWYLASEETSIKVWSCIKSCCVSCAASLSTFTARFWASNGSG